MTTTSPLQAEDARADPSGDASVPAPVPHATYRRVLRRETHSSRSASAIVVLVVLVLVAAYVGVESVYAALSQRALLFSPLDTLSTLATAATSSASVIVIAVGIVTGLVGILLVVLAVAAGRRGRHTVADTRVAVVIDDHVIAAAIARGARTAGRLAPGQVTAWVSRRSSEIAVTPASGIPVDEEAVLTGAREELAETDYQPRVEPRVRVSQNGKLGA